MGDVSSFTGPSASPESWRRMIGTEMGGWLNCALVSASCLRCSSNLSNFIRTISSWRAVCLRSWSSIPRSTTSFSLSRRTSVSLQVQVVIAGRLVKPPRMRTLGHAGWRMGTGHGCVGSSSPVSVHIPILLPDGSSSSLSQRPSSPSTLMLPVMPSEAVFPMMERTFSSLEVRVFPPGAPPPVPMASPHLDILLFGEALKLLPLLSDSTPVTQATWAGGGHLLCYSLPYMVLHRDVFFFSLLFLQIKPHSAATPRPIGRPSPPR